VDSLDNNIPIGRARNWTANSRRIPRSNGEQRGRFQGAAVRKAGRPMGDGCPKNSLQQESVRVGLHRNAFPQPSSASARNSLQCTLPSCPWPHEPRGHELDKFCEPVAPFEAAGRFGLADGEQPSMSRANDAYGHSRRTSRASARDARPSRDVRALHARCTIGARVRRGAN
jgi:hypothetical protein